MNISEYNEQKIREIKDYFTRLIPEIDLEQSDLSFLDTVSLFNEILDNQSLSPLNRLQNIRNMLEETMQTQQPDSVIIYNGIPVTRAELFLPLLQMIREHLASTRAERSLPTTGASSSSTREEKERLIQEIMSSYALSDPNIVHAFLERMLGMILGPVWIGYQYAATAAEKRATEKLLKEIDARNKAGFQAPKPAEKKVTDTYKIHLMPAEYTLGTIYDIVKALDDIDFLGSFKFWYSPVTPPKEGAPYVAIYADGKEDAQKKLNEVYYALRNIPGSGKAPKFNARVTDLIFIAQGDRDKKETAEDFGELDAEYEAPGYVYYLPTFESALPVDYKLRHPETGAKIE